MAIIQPSNDFEGSDLGIKLNPEPGDYTARLHEVHYNPGEKNIFWLQWSLMSPLADFPYRLVSKTYTEKGISFLYQDTYCWKRQRKRHMGATRNDTFETLRSWIGEEANVTVAILNPDKGPLRVVTKIWSLGMQWPPPWYQTEED